mgnify:CR=1 FL=1
MSTIYYFVRTDLKMGKGKIAAQCCHATQYILPKNEPIRIERYDRNGSAKIVLKIPNYYEMINLVKICQKENLPFHIVEDAGKTQIETGSKTVLAIGIVDKGEMSKYISHYKLL